MFGIHRGNGSGFPSGSQRFQEISWQVTSLRRDSSFSGAVHKDNAAEFSYDRSTTVNKITDNRRANVPRPLSRSIGRLPSLEIFQDLHLRVGVKSEVKLSPREIHYRVLGISENRASQHCEQPDKQTTLIYRCNCRILCKSTFGFPQTTFNCQQLCSLKLRRQLVYDEKIPVS